MNYETEFPLESVQGVIALMSNIHYVKVAAYTNGDYDALNLLVDYNEAFQAANITKRQKEALNLVFEKDLTQREAGELLGISQQAVQQLINSVAVRISEYFTRRQGGTVRWN